MTKWVVIALAVFVLYKLITNEKGKRVKKDTKARDRKIAAGKMVKDPSCGTYVDVEGSITVKDGQTVHHFCSYDCRQSFLDKLEASGRELPEYGNRDDEE